MHIPYTYLIKFKPTGQVYYGSRTAKDCHPDDLWVKYFTSSRYVKELIKEHGKDAFEYEVRRIFKTKEACIDWERKILVKFNASFHKNWLNRSNAVGKSYNSEGVIRSDEFKLKLKKAVTGRKHTEESRLKMSISQKNRIITDEHRTKISETKRRNTKPVSGETRLKFSRARKGKPHSEEHSKKIRESNLIRHKNKLWRITLNTGEVKEFHNITTFCKENNYSNAELYRVRNGTARKHKDIIFCEMIIADQVL